MGQHNIEWRDFCAVYDFFLMRKEPRPVQRLGEVDTRAGIFKVSVFRAFKKLLRVEAVVNRFVMTVLYKRNFFIHIIILSFNRKFKSRSTNQLSVYKRVRLFTQIVKRRHRRPPERLEPLGFYTLPDDIVNSVAAVQISHRVSCSRADKSRR